MVDGMKFPSAGAKLFHANTHLQEFYVEREAWRQNEPCTLRLEDQPEGTHYLVRATDLKPVPGILTLILGDIFQCLRTSLDHIVWQLSCDWLGAEPPVPGAYSVAFPIADTRRRFKEAAIAFINPDAQDVITGLQPFETGDPQASPLWQLNELNNRDKHRQLLVAAVAGEITGVVAPGALNMIMGGLFAPPPPGQRLDQNPVLGFVPILPGLPDPAKVNPEASIVYDVLLDEDGIPKAEVTRFIVDLIDWLLDNVVAPLLPFEGVAQT